MGTIVTGAGSLNAQSMMTGTLTIKNTNNPYARMSAIRRSGNKTKAKKPLNYNHREISGQLIRAKKAQSAATALTRAKGKLAVLQRAAGSGQYDEKEIANAIAHARRMVRCAQLKVRNLREEEREQKSHKRESGEHEQQKRNEVKRRVAQKEREIKSKVAIEEMQDIAREKRKRSEMMQKRQMHRNQERGRINEADMKYIKGQLENHRESGSYAVSGTPAVLDLSLEAAMMAEVQLLEQAQQIEAEVEAEISAEMAIDATCGDAAGAVSGGVAVGETSAAESAGATVDVSI